MSVTETFFALHVRDMERARRFYAAAFGAQENATTPRWTSLRIAGVRVGLSLGGEPGPTGLHFAVQNLRATIDQVTGAGGAMTMAPTDLGGGVTIAGVRDSEGNELKLRGP